MLTRRYKYIYGDLMPSNILTARSLIVYRLQSRFSEGTVDGLFARFQDKPYYSPKIGRAPSPPPPIPTPALTPPRVPPPPPFQWIINVQSVESGKLEHVLHTSVTDLEISQVSVRTRTDQGPFETRLTKRQKNDTELVTK